MREHKYRGYYNFGGNALYPPDKRWIYGYYSLQEGKHRINDIADWKMTYAVEDKSVGEYTGLKDKNGTEIYEGDIVKFKFDSDYIYSTVWYCVNHFKYETDDYDLGEIAEDAGSLEVIGNIYENPELL